MFDSVLSPNKSVSNQVLGSVASPQGGIGLDNLNCKQQDLSSDNNSNLEDGLNKENAPTVSYEKDDKLEVNSKESDEEPIFSEASPKRSVEEVEVAEGSPDGCNKKARIGNDAEATDDIYVEPEVAVSPPKTSKSKKSVDDLLADLAKSKDVLGKSKETLKLLKEQQQKLVDNGASMTSRFQAFDEELKQLKEKHAENGKDLEKVLSIRDSARASFKSAEETLQKMSSTKSQIETTSDSAKVANIATNDVEPLDSAADTEEKNDETTVTATKEQEESPDCLVEESESMAEEFIDSDPAVAVDEADEEIVETNIKEQGSPDFSVEPETTKPEEIVPSDPAVDTANKDEEVDATNVKEQENLESPVEEHETKEEENVADNSDVVVAEDDGIFENKQESEAIEETENEAFQTSRDDGPEGVAEMQVNTASFETPFDEKSEEGKANLDFIDDKDADTESEAEEDTKEGGGRNASGTATIDDTLALELQNTDENDSDDDSLISM